MQFWHSEGKEKCLWLHSSGSVKKCVENIMYLAQLATRVDRLNER